MVTAANGGSRGSRGWELALKLLLLFQGLSGVAGGFGLMTNPTGEALGMPLAWLEGSPFTSYLVPGVVLFGVLGVAPLVVFAALLRRAAWAPPAGLLLGVALLVWLAVEIAVVGYHSDPPLQFVYALVGAGLVLASAMSWRGQRLATGGR